VDLEVDEWIPGPGKMTDSQIRESLKKLKKFDDYELQLKKRAEAKNNLESLIYRIRDLLDEFDFSESSKQQEIDDLTNFSSEYSEWLYSDEADEAGADDFIAKFHKINNILKPVVYRIEQRHALENIVEEARERLYDYPHKIEELNKTKSWIPAEQKKQLADSVETTQEWLNLMVEKQEAVARNEDPVLTTAQISNKMQSLFESFNRLKNMQKPKAAARNNFMNFGGGEGENAYYENLRKQYGMSPDATNDEIFQEFMLKSGNKFTTGNEKPEDTKKEEPTHETKEEKNEQEQQKQDDTTTNHGADTGTDNKQAETQTGETGDEDVKNAREHNTDL